MKIEIDIGTKDRYESLALLLWSLCEQSYKNWVVTVVDDSENRKDIRKLPYILPILTRLDNENHEWRVLFGSKKGPHHNHQLVKDKSRSDYIFRVDDDEILDKYALEKMVVAWRELESKGDKVGAIGPIVIDPKVPKDAATLPIGFEIFKKFQGKVDEYGEVDGYQQWCYHPTPVLQEVEHLYSSFLYSREAALGIGGYELGYNVTGHREETDFTYRLFQKGYKLFIQPEAVVWHFRNPSGGIRTFNNSELWRECDEFYKNKFGFRKGKNQDKVVKISGGLGDHLCATPLLRGLKKEGKKVVISAIYPYLFQGNPNVDELIFPPDEVKYEMVNYKDIYKLAYDTGFYGLLSEAYCKFYGVEYDDKLDYTVYPKERVWVKETLKTIKDYILIAPFAARSVIQYSNTTKVGSGGQRTVVKDWILSRWVSLVSEIQKKGIEVYQVGGQGDKGVPGCNRYFLGQDYRFSVALLEQSKGLISVDNFMQHAAFAIGKPAVILFGATDPSIFGHETNVNIYHKNVCRHNRECRRGSPWLMHGSVERGPMFDPCKSKECMKKISVKAVLDKIGKYF
jgi:ADP-heptose:LPS heptosyltransferase